MESVFTTEAVNTMNLIRKRGTKYYYRVYVTDENGQRVRKEYAGTTDRNETIRLMHAAQAEADRMGRLATKMTVEKFFSLWDAEVLSAGNYKINTVRAYKSAIEHYILPALGKEELKSVTPRELQNLLNGLRDEKYSRATVNTVCSILKKALTYATSFAGLIPSNPARDIVLPRFFSAGKEEDVACFTPEEMKKIFAHFPPGHDFYMMISLSYYAGLRLGECCALMWDDVDMKDMTIRICRTLVKQGKEWGFQSPKTENSARTIYFGQNLYKILEAQRLRQMQNRMKYGPWYRDNHLVAPHESGEIMTPDNMRYFGKWCHKTFGRGTFHSLRHTYASQMLEAGADLELVSKQLGHSSIVTTTNIYSHILEKRRKKLVSIIDKAL